MEVTAQEVVWITIVGDKRDDGRIPDDHGLVLRFNRWCAENGILRAVWAGHTGGGSFAGAFDPDDLPAIKEFFEREGFKL